MESGKNRLERLLRLRKKCKKENVCTVYVNVFARLLIFLVEMFFMKDLIKHINEAIYGKVRKKWVQGKVLIEIKSRNEQSFVVQFVLIKLFSYIHINKSAFPYD